MIQKKKSVLWDVILSVIVRERSWNEHAPNSEWLPRWSFFKPAIIKALLMLIKKEKLLMANFLYLAVSCLTL